MHLFLPLVNYKQHLVMSIVLMGIKFTEPVNSSTGCPVHLNEQFENIGLLNWMLLPITCIHPYLIKPAGSVLRWLLVDPPPGAVSCRSGAEGLSPACLGLQGPGEAPSSPLLPFLSGSARVASPHTPAPALLLMLALWTCPYLTREEK